MYKKTTLFLILSLFPMIAFTQSDVNKMLKDINGKVDEIIIKSDGKEYRFSDDEAQTLFSAMKDNKEVKSFTFITKDGKVFECDSSGKKIIIKELGDNSEDSNKQVIVFIDEDDFDSDDTEIKTMEKKVIVSGEGDNKVVNVTINEDGKESIEVYEGKAADEYLEKMKSEKEIQVNVDVKEEDGKKVKKIVIEKEVKE